MPYCTNPEHTHSGYACARCNQTHCFHDDLALLPEIADECGITTMVRYCPHWRCQREKQIEEGAFTCDRAPCGGVR